MLWWRIVAFCDQVLHEKIESDLLQSEVREITDQISKMIVVVDNTQAMPVPAAEGEEKDLF